MTRTPKKFILAAITLIVIVSGLSQCKTKNEVKPAGNAGSVDTTLTKGTAIHSKTNRDSVLAPLTLIIKNLSSSTAPVIVGVYGTKNKFPDPKDQMALYKFKPHGKELTAEITDLKFGTYALAIYQDVNSSGAIDKNIIGIPTEGYAFSNNYKPTIKAPAFDDCRFTYSATASTVTMQMIQ